MNKAVKIILIGAVVVNGCAGIYLTMNPDRIPKKETKPVVTTTVAVKKIDYRRLSDKCLESVYKNMAKKAGTGVPDIDTFITHYEEYHKDGIVITKNNYYIGGNKHITHRYTMEFKEGTNQLIFLMIDGKVLLSNK